MATEQQQLLLRSLPQVEEVMKDPRMEALTSRVPRENLVEIVRSVVDDARSGILAGTLTRFHPEDAVNQAVTRGLELTETSLRPVVNASGVIIHTNLGRSVLAKSAADAVDAVCRSYSTLEYDRKTLGRGSRHDHCEQLICSLTGAEAALAVNNNAAAVMMVLAEFASGHEAVVSRGELVEIGGSFRIPDIMAQSHADMVEVGATNKTHPDDYRRAITDDTAMLLKVHTSNFRMIGFTESVSIKELRHLADQENARRGKDAPQVLVYEDQGSGSLVHLDCFGTYAEPTVQQSLAAGVDLVSFSGDKLLGGPQAGIIVGRKSLINRLKHHPLARALRLDKMTLAALEATLRLYLDTDKALREIPTLAMLTTPASDLQPRAEALKACAEAALDPSWATLDIVEETSRAGGGALPMCDIETRCLQVRLNRGDTLACDRHLVAGRDIPVISRLKNDALLFDVRTLLGKNDYLQIAEGLRSYFLSLES